MIRKYSMSTLVVCGALLAASGAYAQMATTLEQAELAGLTPAKRTEVMERAKQPGQTVYEVLQTMPLNNIKSKLPASRIVALDFNRGTSIVEMQSGGLAAVNFDTTTLALK